MPLPTGAGLIPEAERRRGADHRRAPAPSCWSAPTTPAAWNIPAETLAAFRDLARAHGLALIVDETYRDFDSRTGAPA